MAPCQFGAHPRCGYAFTWVVDNCGCAASATLPPSQKKAAHAQIPPPRRHVLTRPAARRTCPPHLLHPINGGANAWLGGRRVLRRESEDTGRRSLGVRGGTDAMHPSVLTDAYFGVNRGI
eukprot:SAG11_NODE_13916_length_633_cov_1.059925_1_plen_119_part_10